MKTHEGNPTLAERLRDCALTSFQTMCRLTETAGVGQNDSSAGVGAIVDFWGPCTGKLTLKVSRPLIAAMVQGMFGHAQEPTDEDKDGVLKEMCNIICGQLLTFIDPERPFTIGSPRLLSIHETEKHDPVSPRARLSFDAGSAELCLSVVRPRL